MSHADPARQETVYPNDRSIQGSNGFPDHMRSVLESVDPSISTLFGQRFTVQRHEIPNLIEWRACALVPRMSTIRGRWIIVAGHDPVALELQALIHAGGDHVIIVRDGTQLTHQARGTAGVLAGVIDLRPSSATEWVAAPESGSGRETGLSAALSTVQSLVKACACPKVGTWLVTAGVHAASGRVQELANSPRSRVWTYALSSAPEHPQLSLGLIDLDPAEDALSCACQLWAAANDSSGERQFAFANGKIYAARVAKPEHVVLIPAGMPGAD